MKRATYQLPILAVAISTTGCVDPIAERWVATTFDNIPMPFSFEYTNQGGQACASSLSVTLEVYLDLSAALLYTDVVSCEGSAPQSNTYLSSIGDTEAVDKRSEYIIAFDAGQFSIDCVLDGRAALDCVDLDGSPYAFRAAK